MPQSFSELLSDPGVIEVSRLRSRFGFLAIHGGGLEQMTDVIAQRAADAAGASLYLVRHPQRYPHHLSSVRFRPDESPRLAEFLGHVDVAVSLHGYARFGRSTQLLAGGATAPWPSTWPPPQPAGLPDRHRTACHPARASRSASGQPGQPGARRRSPVGAVGAGARHQPAQSTPGRRCRRKRPEKEPGLEPEPDGLSPVTSALVRAWWRRRDRGRPDVDVRGGCYEQGLSFRSGHPLDQKPGALREKVRRLEGFGFDVLNVPDHLGAPAPFPALAAVAASATTARVGTYVLNACFYKPALLARDAAALEVLSEGRLDLGLGAGYVREEFEAAEIPYPSARERVDYLEHVTAYLREHLPACRSSSPATATGC
ncbi:luciferase-like monooxygenase family protein [Mycobacterium xenopi 3993]|nr:luciferase-like monooxygenase family protein [Mycobacterium xenopi 3993]